MRLTGWMPERVCLEQMSRKDPVTPEMRQAVMVRDLREARKVFGPRWMNPCVAPLVDLLQLGKCSGRVTIEHVKDQPRMGVRAASNGRHLVSLCEGHTEGGMKAGFQWNTANRPGLRRYLEGYYEQHEE